MSKVDLHIHSKYSDDGEFSVTEILDRCKGLEMKLVSITDHNSVKAVADALECNAGLRVISGVELDCTYKGMNFHLLGYSFDHTRREFSEIEQDIFTQEMGAAEEKIHLFRKATGIPVSIVEVVTAAKGGIITGELIGEIVLAKENASEFEVLKPYLPGGVKSDMPNVRLYWDYFSPGKPAYVPIRYISLPDGIKLIHKANGFSVLAHPGQNLSNHYNVLNKIIAEGIDGIEVFSSYHSPEEKTYFLNVAKQNGLLITCGSDFHGKNKPNIQIGCHGSTLDDSELIENIIERQGSGAL
ncbi:PHP domain-containing protein [Anaerocolumna aminovalerica]|uniref:PHP domain-containing protein n=1 Tax=Anaerocolumna aminovalerica TaxID=1527 RepID=UPI001C0EDDD6|nr:phosphatase [Anaerocolumna aminovalerica]MBU5330922.1 PHP domain-containing protein [Anaerocolumna aminovalerica]